MRSRNFTFVCMVVVALGTYKRNVVITVLTQLEVEEVVIFIDNSLESNFTTINVLMCLQNAVAMYI